MQPPPLARRLTGALVIAGAVLPSPSIALGAFTGIAVMAAAGPAPGATALAGLAILGRRRRR